MGPPPPPIFFSLLFVLHSHGSPRFFAATFIFLGANGPFFPCARSHCSTTSPSPPVSSENPYGLSRLICKNSIPLLSWRCASFSISLRPSQGDPVLEGSCSFFFSLTHALSRILSRCPCEGRSFSSNAFRFFSVVLQQHFFDCSCHPLHRSSRNIPLFFHRIAGQPSLLSPAV